MWRYARFLAKNAQLKLPYCTTIFACAFSVYNMIKFATADVRYMEKMLLPFEGCQDLVILQYQVNTKLNIFL